MLPTHCYFDYSRFSWLPFRSDNLQWHKVSVNVTKKWVFIAVKNFKLLTQGFGETIILDLIVYRSCTVERETYIYNFTLYDFVDFFTRNQKDEVVINAVEF